MTEHAPNSMVTDGNYIFGGIHAIMYTKVEVYCCTHETYYVISQCYFNEKELKRKFFFFFQRETKTNLNIPNTGTLAPMVHTPRKIHLTKQMKAVTAFSHNIVEWTLTVGTVEGKSHSDSMMDLFL